MGRYEEWLLYTSIRDCSLSPLSWSPPLGITRGHLPAYGGSCWRVVRCCGSLRESRRFAREDVGSPSRSVASGRPLRAADWSAPETRGHDVDMTRLATCVKSANTEPTNSIIIYNKQTCVFCTPDCNTCSSSCIKVNWKAQRWCYELVKWYPNTSLLLYFNRFCEAASSSK